MTNLTEQWKKGELPNGWYWVDYYSVDGAVMIEYIPQHNGFGYEEKDEVQEAYRQYCKELADVIIVCAGIYRFDPEKAKEEAMRIDDICDLKNIDKDYIEKEVNRKWQINLKRKWEWNGKTYHHVEE